MLRTMETCLSALRPRVDRLPAAGALLLLALTGCLQSEGERCQVDSDCDDGLSCCVGESVDEILRGGVCRAKDKCVLVRGDAGILDGGARDGAPGDAGADTGVDSRPDGPAQRDATTDLPVREDAGAPEAGSDGSSSTDGPAGDAPAVDGSADMALDAASG